MRVYGILLFSSILISAIISLKSMAVALTVLTFGLALPLLFAPTVLIYLLSGLVLPNYFAPFERRTVTIACAWKLRAPSGLPMRLYRADSDQDRPNALPLPRRAGLAGL